jgi:hypothetical protein
MIQQNYFNLIDKDICLSVIKYNTNNNTVQYIDGQILNKNIINVYNSVCKKVGEEVSSNSLNIIYDLSLIFYFFGNDHFPASSELSAELSLEYYCITHYKTFNKLNTTIIKLDKDFKVIFDLNNFKLYLIEIYKNNEINKTKIKLGKYFKLNYNLSCYLTDKLNFDFDKIILLCKKILFDDAQKYDNLDEDDLRYKLKQKYTDIDFNIDSFDKNELNKLLQCLDITDTEENYCGLPLYVKQFYLSENDYENLYLHFNEEIVNELSIQYPIIFDNKEFINTNTSDEYIDSFLKKIYHLTYSLFGNMNNYNSNNFTYFIGYEIPSIKNIIEYLEQNNSQENKWLKSIESENYDVNNYFNSINHYLIITPYIKEILYKFKTVDFKYFVENINIDNLWLNIENTNDILYKDINYIKFLNTWKETLIKLSLNIKTSPKILVESEQYLLSWI